MGTSKLVEIHFVVRVTETLILDRKVKVQGHTGRLNYRILVALFHDIRRR